MCRFDLICVCELLLLQNLVIPPNTHFLGEVCDCVTLAVGSLELLARRLSNLTPGINPRHANSGPGIALTRSILSQLHSHTNPESRVHDQAKTIEPSQQQAEVIHSRISRVSLLFYHMYYYAASATQLTITFESSPSLTPCVPSERVGMFEVGCPNS